MAAHTPATNGSGMKPRKGRSIEVLCHRLISFLPPTVAANESWEMTIDQVVKQFNASKGAVYEVFHVLESTLLVTKIGTNTFRWNGTDDLQVVLSWLKILAESDQFHILDRMNAIRNAEVEGLVRAGERKVQHLLHVLEPADGEDASTSDQNQRKNQEGKMANKKKLHILGVCQQFIMIFLVCLQPKTVNLDFAAKVIHGTRLSEQAFKSRTRRLYDIANVLQALRLIRKVQVTESRGKRAAFQYIGPDVDKFFPTAEDIMSLPDYRRKHLYFSLGKSMLGIEERPTKLEGISMVRMEYHPDPQTNEQRIFRTGLDLDRMAVEELWGKVDLVQLMQSANEQQHQYRVHAPRRRRHHEVEMDVSETAEVDIPDEIVADEVVTADDTADAIEDVESEAEEENTSYKPIIVKQQVENVQSHFDVDIMEVFPESPSS